MRLSFYKKDKTIYFSLFHEYKRIRISTGIILPDNNDFKDGVFVGDKSDELNEFLSRKRTEIYSLWRERNELDYVKKMYKPEYFKLKPGSSFEIVFMLTEHLKEMQQMRRHSKTTLLGYGNSIRRLNEFVVASGRKIDLVDYAVDYRDSIYTRKRKSDEYIGFFRSFEDYLADCQYVLSSRFTIMNGISVMLGGISKQYHLSLPKMPIPVLKYNPVTTLPPDFVAKFISDQYRIYDMLTNDQKYAWEIAATILITTFRVSDAKSLCMNDIIERDGSMYIQKMNKKRAVYSYLPLPKKLALIYKSNYDKFGSIYTQHSDEIYIPDAIRDVFSMIDEMNEPMIVKKIGVNGEEVVKTMPAWMAVHPHMLRKTAITTMIYMGVSERHIKFASGHSEHSKSFERYVGHVEKMFQSEFTNYYEKLGI